jgi:hypothetical protein
LPLVYSISISGYAQPVAFITPSRSKQQDAYDFEKADLFLLKTCRDFLYRYDAKNGCAQAPGIAAGGENYCSQPSQHHRSLLCSVDAAPAIVYSDQRPVFQVPLLGAYLKRAGHIPVEAGKGQEAIDAAVALLKKGHTVVIFPEGVISPLEGGFHEARTGVARIAL